MLSGTAFFGLHLLGRHLLGGIFPPKMPWETSPEKMPYELRIIAIRFILTGGHAKLSKAK